jgi:hypothetical protein
MVSRITEVNELRRVIDRDSVAWLESDVRDDTAVVSKYPVLGATAYVNRSQWNKLKLKTWTREQSQLPVRNVLVLE